MTDRKTPNPQDPLRRIMTNMEMAMDGTPPTTKEKPVITHTPEDHADVDLGGADHWFATNTQTSALALEMSTAMGINPYTEQAMNGTLPENLAIAETTEDLERWLSFIESGRTYQADFAQRVNLEKSLLALKKEIAKRRIAGFKKTLDESEKRYGSDLFPRARTYSDTQFDLINAQQTPKMLNSLLESIKNLGAEPAEKAKDPLKIDHYAGIKHAFTDKNGKLDSTKANEFVLAAKSLIEAKLEELKAKKAKFTTDRYIFISCFNLSTSEKRPMTDNKGNTLSDEEKNAVISFLAHLLII